MECLVCPTFTLSIIAWEFKQHCKLFEKIEIKYEYNTGELTARLFKLFLTHKTTTLLAFSICLTKTNI